MAPAPAAYVQPMETEDRPPLTSPALPGPRALPARGPGACSRAEQVGGGQAPVGPSVHSEGSRGADLGSPEGTEAGPGTRGPWPSPPGGCGKGRPHPPAFQTRCTGFPALGAQVRVQVWLRLAARRPQYPASAPPPLGAQRMAPHDSHVSPEHPPPSPNPGATAAGHATVPHHPGSWPGCTELQQRGLFILMAVYRPALDT